MQERPKDEIGGNIARSGILSLVMLAAMFAVYFALGKFSGKVVLGGIIGLLAAMLNLVLLGNAVRDAMAVQDQTLAAQKLRASYTGRMLLMIAATGLAFLIPQADALACILALLFPRFGIMLIQFIDRFLRKKGSGS